MRSWLTTSSAILVLFGSVTPSAAAPSVFYYGAEPGDAWWLQRAVIRPMAQGIGNLSLVELNAHSSFQNERDSLCYVEQLSGNSLQGIFRSTHENILRTTSSLDFDPFFQRFQAGSEEAFEAYVAVYERCNGVTGFAIAVINEVGSLAFLELWDSEERGSSLRYIYPTDDGHIGLSGCFECGDHSVLRYDVRARRFYWEYLGD